MHSSLFSPVHIRTFPYTYEIMEKDIAELLFLYPNYLKTEVFARSAEGRALYAITLGNPDAPYSLLVQAGIHGREWMNCLLVMMQLSALCGRMESSASSAFFCRHGRKKYYYHGISYQKLFSKVCVHVLPMTNPDGVTISQRICPLWKANARGVNLNSNFQAGFSTLPSTKLPHYKDYKGPAFHSEPESQALVQYTKKYKPDVVISYHETGSLLYGNYGQQGSLKKRCYRLLDNLAKVSGYPISPDYAVSGGYSDWCVRLMKIPACTIETGTGTAPISYSQLPSLWQKNRLILPAAAFSILVCGISSAVSPVPAKLE